MADKQITELTDAGALGGSEVVHVVQSSNSRKVSFTTLLSWIYTQLGWVAASASGPSSLDFKEDTDNGSNRVRVIAPASVASDADVTLPGVTGHFLSTAESKTIAKGFLVTPYSGGTVSSGTFTPDAANGNYQYYTNNGAHTFAVPAADCAIDILITNGASAGAITFSGYTVGTTGDALTTTNTSKFVVSVRRINSISTYLIKALQ